MRSAIVALLLTMSTVGSAFANVSPAASRCDAFYEKAEGLRVEHNMLELRALALRDRLRDIQEFAEESEEGVLKQLLAWSKRVNVFRRSLADTARIVFGISTLALRASCYDAGDQLYGLSASIADIPAYLMGLAVPGPNAREE